MREIRKSWSLAGRLLALAVVAALPIGGALGVGTAPAVAEAQTAAQAATADDQPGKLALSFQEWPVPWPRTRPRDPAVAPDGTIWFVGQQGDYLGHLDPETGEMRRFALSEGAGPHTVIVDKQGYPWYAGNRDRHIGRLEPATGKITRYDMPEGVDDPHTMDWTSDGRIWFTAQRSPPAGYVGLFNPRTGEAQAIKVPGQAMRPYGLVVDANDRPWIAFMGKNAIGTVDPATMELEIIETPDSRSRIRRLGLTSDGRVWWVDAAAGFLGVYDPESRAMRQWQSPGGERSSLYATAVDARDRVWYVEAGLNPNRFIGFDTQTEEFVSINEVPSGGGSVRHMVYHRPTNTIWFGTDTHTIGRAVVP
jgi:virginiamycin B lyase